MENVSFAEMFGKRKIFVGVFAKNVWNTNTFEKIFAKMFTKTKNFAKMFGIPIFSRKFWIFAKYKRLLYKMYSIKLSYKNVVKCWITYFHHRSDTDGP